jgi:hypothetical protein
MKNDIEATVANTWARGIESPPYSSEDLDDDAIRRAHDNSPVDSGQAYGIMTYISEGHVFLKLWGSDKLYAIRPGVDYMANCNVIDYIDIPEELQYLIKLSKPYVTDTTGRKSPAYGTIDAWQLGFVFSTENGKQIASYTPWRVLIKSLHAGQPVVSTKAMEDVGAVLQYASFIQPGSFSNRPGPVRGAGGGVSQSPLHSLQMNEVGPMTSATWTCTAQGPQVSALYASTNPSARRNTIAEMSSTTDYDVMEGCTCEDDAAFICAYCRAQYQDGEEASGGDQNHSQDNRDHQDTNSNGTNTSGNAGAGAGGDGDDPDDHYDDEKCDDFNNQQDKDSDDTADDAPGLCTDTESEPEHNQDDNEVPSSTPITRVNTCIRAGALECTYCRHRAVLRDEGSDHSATDTDMPSLASDASDIQDNLPDETEQVRSVQQRPLSVNRQLYCTCDATGAVECGYCRHQHLREALAFLIPADDLSPIDSDLDSDSDINQDDQQHLWHSART